MKTSDSPDLFHHLYGNAVTKCNNMIWPYALFPNNQQQKYQTHVANQQCQQYIIFIGIQSHNLEFYSKVL